MKTINEVAEIYKKYDFDVETTEGGLIITPFDENEIYFNVYFEEHLHNFYWEVHLPEWLNTFSVGLLEAINEFADIFNDKIWEIEL